MHKIEYHGVIKFFVKEGLMPNEIHTKFIIVYGDSIPSFSTIKKWVAKFKRGLAVAALKMIHVKDVQKCNSTRNH
jgi:hypothetical protein